MDRTDGITPEVAITVTSCKLTLMVDDANVPTLVLDVAPTASGGSNDMVHVTGDDAGFYDLELAAANVNYLGRAMLAITDAATHCPVFHEFMILPAMVYDSLVLGTDTLQADATQWNGTNVSSPATAGIPEVNVKNINNVAASSVTTVSANVGTTQPVNFTGTGASALAKSDMVDVAGAAVSTSSAQVGVNVVNLGGSAVDATSGLINANVKQISTDAVAADNLEKAYDGTGYGVVLQATTIATLASQTSFTLTAGSADDDAYNGAVIVVEDQATQAQKAVGVILDYTGSTKTVALLADPAVFTMATTDLVTILADRSLKPTVSNRNLDVSTGGEAGVDWANVGSPTTVVGLSGTTVKTATDVETDTADIQARLPAALTVGGNIKADSLALSGDTVAADNAEAFFDGTGYAGTNNVIPTVTTLTNAPSDSSGVTTLLSRLSALRAGYLDNLSAGAVALEASLQGLITTVGVAGAGLTATATAVWAVATRLLTAGTNIVLAKGTGITGFNDPTVGAIADQVWEETLADHSGTAGSTAAALNAAGAAGDPWSTALPGAYGAGTAGKIVGDNVDATISSRATPAQVNTEADQALADYDAPTKAELDSAVAPLALASDLATVAGYLDTEIAAIKLKTDNLPASPAAVGSAMTLTAAYDAAKTAATQTSVDDLPTNAELATALGTADDAVLAAIAALNNLSSANVSSAITAAALATAANLALAKTAIDAIKVQSDKLTFDAGNHLAANVLKVHDVTLDGVGTAADPWGPV